MFDVVSALESRKRRKRLRFATFSVAVHGVILGSLVAASLWQVGDIAPPEVVPIVFHPDLPHSPSAGGGGHPPAPPPHRVAGKGTALPRILQPVAIPTGIPSVVPPTDVALPTTDDNPTGTNFGIGGGPGGPDSPCLTDCGEGPEQPIYPTGGDVRAPVGTYQPEPPYPGPARIAHQQGVVILQAIIGTDGSVENLSVLKGGFPFLDEAAVSAVSRWRYTPATLNGRSVRVYLTVTVNFRLN